VALFFDSAEESMLTCRQRQANREFENTNATDQSRVNRSRRHETNDEFIFLATRQHGDPRRNLCVLAKNGYEALPGSLSTRGHPDEMGNGKWEMDNGM
jgi:hypothetical protein